MHLFNSLINSSNFDIIIIFLIAAAPIGELRFSIPYGLLLTNIPHFTVIFVSIIGNILAGLFIIYLFPMIINILSKISLINKIYNSIINRTYSKSAVIQKRKYYGLIFFVSLPFPFTGVWTGALASNLIGLSKHKSIVAIILGVCISATAVTLMVYLGIFTINSIQ